MKIKQLLLIFLMICIIPSSSFSEEISIQILVKGAVRLSKSEVKDLFDKGVLFVDVRKEEQWKLGHVPKAYHLDVMDDGFNKKALLEKAKFGDKIVIYGESLPCLSAPAATKRIVGYGFTNVHYYIGGYPIW